GTRRGHHPEARRPDHRRRPVVAEDALHVLLGDERLHRAGQPEADYEGPQRLPEHEERLAQAVADVTEPDGGDGVGHDRTRRAMAADASATFSSAAAPP